MGYLQMGCVQLQRSVSCSDCRCLKLMREIQVSSLTDNQPNVCYHISKIGHKLITYSIDVEESSQVCEDRIYQAINGREEHYVIISDQVRKMTPSGISNCLVKMPRCSLRISQWTWNFDFLHLHSAIITPSHTHPNSVQYSGTAKAIKTQSVSTLIRIPFHRLYVLCFLWCCWASLYATGLFTIFLPATLLGETEKASAWLCGQELELCGDQGQQSDSLCERSSRSISVPVGQVCWLGFSNDCNTWFTNHFSESSVCQIGGPVVLTSGSLYGGATGFNSRVILFSVYINDVALAASDSLIHLYADDTKSNQMYLYSPSYISWYLKSAVQKPSLKPQTASNAGVEAQ
jgi:hypothetical protein